MNYLEALSDSVCQTQVQTVNSNLILDCKEGEILGGSPHRVLYLLLDRPSQWKIHNLFLQQLYKQVSVTLHAVFYS